MFYRLNWICDIICTGDHVTGLICYDCADLIRPPQSMFPLLEGINLEQDLTHKEDLPAKGQPGKGRKEEGCNAC